MNSDLRWFNGAVLALGATLSVGLASAAVRKDSDTAADLPAGIFLNKFSVGGLNSLVLTDGTHLSLYTNANDTRSGPASCYAECLKEWRPAVPARGARPVRDWTILKRRDGTLQWAFHGKPLYRYAGDDSLRNIPVVGQARYVPQSAKGEGLDKVWSAAVLNPGKWIKFPAGFDVEEFPIAPGHILTRSDGQPLYAFYGSSAKEQRLSKAWHPYLAGIIEHAVGDFAFRDRPDGSRQWTYKKAPLYTFDGDIEKGDLNGKDTVPGLSPIILFRYYQPQGVLLGKDQRRGGRLFDASTGHTLYFHDRHHFSPFSYNARGLLWGDPLVGDKLGVSTCDSACETTWRPLLAPRDARPSGYWSVLARPDGKKQWAYRGYALYSNGREPAGTTYGAETWTMNISLKPGDKINENFGLGLFWRVAVP